MPSNLRGNLAGQPRTRIEHGQDHSLDREIGIEVIADQIDRRDELAQAFEGVVLTLDRNEHGIGGCQRIDRQQSKRRRAVE